MIPNLTRLLLFVRLLFLYLCLPLTACEGKQESNNKLLSTPVCQGEGDSVKVCAGIQYKKNKLHNFLFGKHHRELWIQPITVEVFDINKEMGGFKILKKGGSLQTLNLRLESKEGKEYVLRTVNKDHSNVLPPILRSTFLSYLFNDQISALNPYAAIIIPPLAEAAYLYHTNPKLYYIPYDTSFGQYAREFEGKLAIVEEHPGDTWAGSKMFGSPDDILDTDDFLEARYGDQNVRVARLFYAKNRLFDILIGDWDRHPDQWKWARYDMNNGMLLYKPIPRDRDMAFYKFDDGFLTFLATYIIPKFQTFHYSIPDLKGMIKNARYLDRMILPTLSKEEWEQIAFELQSQLTDSVIENTVKTWPKEVYKIAGKETAAKLKWRRDKLTQVAMELYQLVNVNPLVAGTEKGEYIEITRKPEETVVRIYKDDSKEVMTYNVSFDNQITEEIEIRALGGADEILVTGETQKGILIKIYGGNGRDKVTDQSEVAGIIKKTRYYDTKGDNQIFMGVEAEDNTTFDPMVHEFNKTGEKKRLWGEK